MNEGLKRVLTIVGITLAAVLLTWVIYRFVFKKPAAPGTGPEGELPLGITGQLPPAGERGTATGPEGGVGPDGLPVSGAGGALAPSAPGFYQPEPVSQIVTDFAAHTSVGSDGGVRFQNQSDGKFYRLGADGTLRAMSDQVFYNVQNVTWAKSANKAVLEYPDSSKIIYNFEAKTQVTLPSHWQEFSFSPDSNQVAAKSLGLAPENRWLVTVNDNGTGTTLVEPLGEFGNKVNVDWSPSRQAVALSRTGESKGEYRQEVLFVGLNGENFKSTIVEGRDFLPQWSPTGKQLLYSVDSARSDFKPELWIVDAYGESIGNNRRLIKLNTWADKCAFADDTTLYCAVPQSLPQGAGMAPEVADSIPDDVYKIDLRTGLKTNIPTGGESYYINSISVDQASKAVIFTDRNKRGVFKVNF